MRGDGYVPYSEEGGFLSGRDPAPGCLPALECVPPHARETLRSGLYWRGVGVAVVEIVGAVAAWRGLWNLGDALLGTAPGADAAHAALGLAVVAAAQAAAGRTWGAIAVASVELIGGIVLWQGLWNLADATLRPGLPVDAAQVALGLSLIVATGVLNLALSAPPGGAGGGEAGEPAGAGAPGGAPGTPRGEGTPWHERQAGEAGVGPVLSAPHPFMSLAERGAQFAHEAATGESHLSHPPGTAPGAHGPGWDATELPERGGPLPGAASPGGGAGAPAAWARGPGAEAPGVLEACARAAAAAAAAAVPGCGAGGEAPWTLVVVRGAAARGRLAAAAGALGGPAWLPGVPPAVVVLRRLGAPGGKGGGEGCALATGALAAALRGAGLAPTVLAPPGGGPALVAALGRDPAAEAAFAVLPVGPPAGSPPPPPRAPGDDVAVL